MRIPLSLLLTLATLLTGCQRSGTGPTKVAPVPGISADKLVATVLVAQELGPLGPRLVEAIGQAGSVRVTPVAVPLAQLTARVKAGGADYVLGPGPDDLVELDQAGLLLPGTGVTVAKAPLVILQGSAKPASLAELAKVTGNVGVPDAASGAVAAEVRKQLKKAAPGFRKERLVEAPPATLIPWVKAGKLAAAVLPAYALEPGETAVAAQTTPSPVSNVMLTALRDAPNHYGMEQLQRTLDRFSDPALLAGTKLEPATRDKGKAAKGQGLFIFAGAGIREPLEAAATAFTQQTGIPVRYTYTGSACLLAQITMAQTGDVYIPGEAYFMDQASQRGYIVSQQRVAYFIPVIMTRKGNPKQIKTLQDLTRPGVAVGLGEPKSCAIGTFTEKLLRKLNLYDAVERNTKMHTALAAEMGTALKLESIDACINWDAVAAWFANSAEIIPIPPDQNESTAILAGVLKFAKNKEAAQRYVDFLAGPEGRAIFRKARYTVDPKQPIFPYRGGA